MYYLGQAWPTTIMGRNGGYHSGQEGVRGAISGIVER